LLHLHSRPHPHLNLACCCRLYEADTFTPSITTLYRLVVALGEAPAGSTIDIDDVRVSNLSPAQHTHMSQVAQQHVRYMFKCSTLHSSASS
jgi:hypothetical protein